MADPNPFMTRIKNAWNAFRGVETQSPLTYRELGPAYSYRPDRTRFTPTNERTIISSIYNRIGIDVAAIKVHHVRKDENDRFTEVIGSTLEQCLNISANVDQTGRAFMQDVAMSLFDEGAVAIVPTDTSINPKLSASYDILALRVGQILEWYPQHVRLRVYNEQSGRREDITLPKTRVAIIENPLYAVMNEPNSTMKRLAKKLALLDVIDEQSSAGKLDLIIQLPYVIKSDARREQADKRRKDIEMQLAGSKYGIAYTDGTERITQLNRPAENNLMSQIEYLTSMLYSQLGITKEVLEGSADDKMMLNYYNRTVEPVIAAITDAMERVFLTKTARSQGQGIMYFNDPFKLVPVTELADIADKLTRNEIISSNEMRAIMGYKPVNDARADELRNKNLNAQNDQLGPEPPSTIGTDDEPYGEYEY